MCPLSESCPCFWKKHTVAQWPSEPTELGNLLPKSSQEAQHRKKVAGAAPAEEGSLARPHLISKEIQELREFFEGFAVQADSLETLYQPFQGQGCLD